MRFTFVTLFKNLIDGYFQDSILNRAIKNSLIKIDFVNPRDFAINKHHKCDDYKNGGGAGLLMTPQPLDFALKDLKNRDPKAYILFMTPSAKTFNQKDAIRLSKKDHIVLISGRYEGIDERIIEIYADEIFSIGDFILTGGELPSMVVCDSISRNICGVLGNNDSLIEESFNDDLLESPSFTKPAKYQNYETPSELLKGNHSRIAAFNKSLSKLKTKFHRPDLYKKVQR